MKVIQIVGKKGHGKTTLLTELLRELTGRGLRVGTVKHSGHDHPLDRPGSDSDRHRAAGGRPAAFVTTTGLAVFLPREPERDPLEALAPLFRGTDLVLVEGWAERPGPKVEVWRRELGTRPLAPDLEEVIAVVTDDAPPPGVTAWPRRNVPLLADRLLKI